MQYTQIKKLSYRQQGITLVVALLFLLILTIISVFAATNSTLELKMASNMQDSFTSFQSAEAGAKAVLGLAGTANDPFDGVATDDESSPHPNDQDPADDWQPGWDPFFSWADTDADHPLANLTDTPQAVDVTLNLTTAASSCPRAANGFSSDILACDHYDVGSIHDVEQRARTEVHLGVVKTVIGNAVL